MVAGTSTLFLLSPNCDRKRQNYIDYTENFTYTDYRTLVRYRLYGRGFKRMFNENEEKFMSIIRENDNPEQAAVIAIKVFAAFLARLEADQELQPVCLLESS